MIQECFQLYNPKKKQALVERFNSKLDAEIFRFMHFKSIRHYQVRAIYLASMETQRIENAQS